MAIRVMHRDDQDVVRMTLIARDARLVVWPGVGASTANMNYVDMQPGERNVPHIHPESEDTIYILDGHGSIEDLDAGVRLEFTAGQAVHVPVGVRHAVAADRGTRIESVGGFCPADWSILGQLGYEREQVLSSVSRNANL
jgi:quercetin dioxygenase-like cupin family protein